MCDKKHLKMLTYSIMIQLWKTLFLAPHFLL